MPELGSATINAVDNQRHAEPYQEPIGADTADTHPSVLANGTIGGGFNAVDGAANFTLETPGVSNEGAGTIDSLYVVADVPVTAGAAAVTVAAGHITAATGGTYTSPKALKAGEYGWVYLT